MDADLKKEIACFKDVLYIGAEHDTDDGEEKYWPSFIFEDTESVGDGDIVGVYSLVGVKRMKRKVTDSLVTVKEVVRCLKIHRQ